MSLPPEVVKEIDVEFAEFPFSEIRDFSREDIERLCLLTRRLTIEECAKICHSRAMNWNKEIPDGQEREFGWMHDEAFQCSVDIRYLLEGK